MDMPLSQSVFLQLYDAKRFQSGGFRHYELYFPDGSCPSEKIIDTFLATAEQEKGELVFSLLHCCLSSPNHTLPLRVSSVHAVPLRFHSSQTLTKQ